MSAVDRILWNRRPTSPAGGGDIDEIVLHNATVHIEQMDDRCWWIGITRPDGSEWTGNFTCNKGRMRFSQQDNDSVVWDVDDTHEVAP